MRLFRKLNLSPQKPEKIFAQKNRKDVKRWIREEWPKIEEHRRKWRAMLYFQDESGISLIPVLGKTCAPKGKTPKVLVTGKRGGFCVTSAISPAGKLIFRIEKGRVVIEKCNGFIKSKVMKHTWMIVKGLTAKTVFALTAVLAIQALVLSNVKLYGYPSIRIQEI